MSYYFGLQTAIKNLPEQRSLRQKVSCFFHHFLCKFVTIKQIIPNYNALSVTTAL